MTDSTKEKSLIPESEFAAIASSMVARWMQISRYLERLPLDTTELTRPLLGEMMSKSAQLVEFFDAYGARNNEKWHYMRHLMAAGKLFSTVGYTLLHIQHSICSYSLLSRKEDMLKATHNAIQFNNNVILCMASESVREGILVGIELPEKIAEKSEFTDALPLGVLERNKSRTKIRSAAETVAHVSTAFLNLAAESDTLHVFDNLNEDEYFQCVPSPISEEVLRMLELKFHNLQSIYDTYVTDTDTELLDPDLPFLRGHISIIFHLLEAATHYCHYYERHLYIRQSEQFLHPLVDPDQLLKFMIEYLIHFSSTFLKDAVSLCQKMLGRYAEKGEISVPVPKYRGFHVRPSTLVAKICLHYGSEIRMVLGEDKYDASAPLDLFRANEYINAVKRRRLAQELETMQVAAPEHLDDFTEAIRLIVYNLSYHQKIVIYENPLPIREISAEECQEQLFSQLVLNEIARLLAMGKLDIESDLKVTFTGDTRVLHDLSILADNGYGEDESGNNIPLPWELSYLKR